MKCKHIIIGLVFFILGMSLEKVVYLTGPTRNYRVNGIMNFQHNVPNTFIETIDNKTKEKRRRVFFLISPRIFIDRADDEDWYMTYKGNRLWTWDYRLHVSE